MQLINQMLLPPSVPWTQFLHNIIQRTRQTKKERGMARPSKVRSAMKKFAQLKMAEHGDKDEEELSPQIRMLLRSVSNMKRMPVFPGIRGRQLINQMLLPPSVPWTQFLHNIIQRTRQTKKERGMARPSKVRSAMKKFAQLKMAEHGDKDEEELSPQIRMLLRSVSNMKRMPVFPGIKHSNKYTMVYAVDTSGSMGTDELQRGLAELQHVQKSDSDVNICVLYADTRICKEYWIGANDEIDPGMTGRGGTDFEHVFQYVRNNLLVSQEKAPDILIYCTDGYAPPPQTKLPIPVVWLITPRGRACCEDAGHITIEMRDYQLGESY